MRPYLAIARIDHWFKNVFILPGILFALFADPARIEPALLVRSILAIAGTCLIASGYYVLNELLDGERDRLHPVKRNRPAASGLIKARPALALWLGLSTLGMLLGLLAGPKVGLVSAWLVLMGIIYNVPPLRSKERPHLDVLSESVNNPIRFLLGWYATGTLLFPPISIVLAYWMLGAFLMAIKRLAEYRHIGDPQVAAAYRSSFAWYDESRLLVAIMFYGTAFGMFSGIFIVRYHIELCLTVPLVAGFMAAYLRLGLKPDSPVQYPEQLYRHRGFMAYTALTFLLVMVVLQVRIPLVERLFMPTIPVRSLVSDHSVPEVNSR
jgi:4-hydroxybenzoate polyprenyltransferase